jgi:tRNA(Ile)-lysidine synthetase-like protein
VTRDSEGKLIARTARRQDFDLKHLLLELGGVSGDFLFDGVQFRWQTCLKKGISFPVAPGQETFDFDSVGSRIALRHWRPGDRFQPLGMSQPIKLQDLFTNAKVPRDVRHSRIVATSASGELFWVEGMRISERFKLTKKTIRRLQWQWERF